MEVGNVEYYNKAQGGFLPNHMAMYYELNGYIPTATRDKIFTGTCLSTLRTFSEKKCKRFFPKRKGAPLLTIVNKINVVFPNYRPQQ